MIRFYQNNILKWIFGNYLTYILSFLSSIIVAKKLGVNLYGNWAEILLYISYITQLNFGITHSYYLSQITDVENSPKKQLEYLVNSLFIIFILSGIFILIFLLNYYFRIFNTNIFSSYKFIYILIASILALINSLISNYYRINNKINILLSISLISPISLIISSLFFNGVVLFQILTIQVVFIPFLSLIYILRPILDKFTLKVTYTIIKEIFYKGLILFFYNSSFYFIVLVLRTFYNNFSSVTEFGYFSFAMVLCNSIILFIDSTSFVIQTRLLKENAENENSTVVITNVEKINRVFSTLATSLSFMFILIIPIFNYVVPEYANSLKLAPILLFCLSINYLSSGSVIYLMSKNRLFHLTISSFIALLICIIFLTIFYLKFNVNYYPFAVFVSYFTFNILTYFFVLKNAKVRFILKDFIFKVIQLNIYFPIILSLIAIVLNLNYLLVISSVIFIVFNFNNVNYLFRISINILKNH
jgi:O-antigen/teichoic acid export membrane protein